MAPIVALTTEHPKNIPTLHQLSVIQERIGKISDAGATVKRALAIEPKDAKSCNYYALMWANSAAETGISKTASSVPPWEKITALFLRATELDPRYADAWFNLAVARTTLKPPNLQAAREAYKRAVELGAQRDPAMEQQIQWKT